MSVGEFIQIKHGECLYKNKKRLKESEKGANVRKGITVKSGRDVSWV